MNMWTERGKTITPEKLLGKNFLAKDKKLTKEEYLVQKKELEKMTKKHTKMLKRIKSGEMENKTAIKIKKK